MAKTEFRNGKECVVLSDVEAKALVAAVDHNLREPYEITESDKLRYAKLKPILLLCHCDVMVFCQLIDDMVDSTESSVQKQAFIQFRAETIQWINKVIET